MTCLAALQPTPRKILLVALAVQSPTPKYANGTHWARGGGGG